MATMYRQLPLLFALLCSTLLRLLLLPAPLLQIRSKALQHEAGELELKFEIGYLERQSYCNIKTR